MPLQATSGAASYDAFGGGVPVVPNYIEDVFSTYLYTGNDTSQTITNGIDLSTKGGLVWTKDRTDAVGHRLKDTTLGTTYFLESNSTSAQIFGNYSWQFNSNGYQFSTGNSNFNYLNSNYVSWSLRKQPKFFDVVTYTGDGLSAQQIAHSLGSVPGCVIVKPTSTTGNWGVWHRGNGTTDYTGLSLNQTTAAQDSGAGFYSGFTSTYFTPRLVEDASLNVGNLNGVTYVAYVFAHDAGGFGLTGTDNVISCGSFTADGTGNATVSLGYEPQWIMVKRSSGGTGDWQMRDNMRGFFAAPNNSSKGLIANGSDAESDQGNLCVTSTGFTTAGSGGLAPDSNYIYIAIRRGPMKVPTSGTSVFNTVLWTGNSTNNRQITGVGFNPDFVEAGTRSAATTFDRVVVDRLRGTSPYLATYATQIEQSNSDLESFDNDGITVDYVSSGAFNNNSNIYGHFFKRAPSFFDVVCAAGTSTSNQRISHNLTVVPELIITKGRDRANAWPVYSGSINSIIYLNSTSAIYTNGSYFPWGTSAPTTTDFGINSGTIDLDSFNGVFYLFATCAGVSKVGSYTGTGTTKQIDCGFTGGARFVLIKRTDSTGDWYVWDSARGIVSGNDPYLLLNSTAVEVTNTDYIDTYSAGFEISSTAPAAINSSASGATYIFLAIA